MDLTDQQIARLLIGISFTVDLDPKRAEQLADLHGLTTDQLRRGIAHLESSKPLEGC